MLRDSIRPFAREAQPSAAKLVPAATPPGQGHAGPRHADQDAQQPHGGARARPAGEGVNGNSYLYYVPWAGHNTNSVMASQDGMGPVRHTLVLYPCGSLDILDRTSQNIAKNPDAGGDAAAARRAEDRILRTAGIG